MANNPQLDGNPGENRAGCTREISSAFVAVDLAKVSYATASKPSAVKCMPARHTPKRDHPARTGDAIDFRGSDTSTDPGIPLSEYNHGEPDLIPQGSTIHRTKSLSGPTRKAPSSPHLNHRALSASRKATDQCHPRTSAAEVLSPYRTPISEVPRTTYPPPVPATRSVFESIPRRRPEKESPKKRRDARWWSETMLAVKDDDGGG
ncbi:hypothetical protein KM043_015809 [Ampulex compressa]|nr:hypothetical protein KM043_015809 [Ampulex compressa]